MRMDSHHNLFYQNGSSPLTGDEGLGVVVNEVLCRVSTAIVVAVGWRRRRESELSLRLLGRLGRRKGLLLVWPLLGGSITGRRQDATWWCWPWRLRLCLLRLLSSYHMQPSGRPLAQSAGRGPRLSSHAWGRRAGELRSTGTRRSTALHVVQNLICCYGACAAPHTTRRFR